MASPVQPPSGSPDAESSLGTPADPSRPATASLPVRAVLVGIGTVALVIGLVGIVLPVVPTTPFLLLAAACYARASDRLYRWLLGQPALGPIITEWRRSRSIPPGTRNRAIVLVVVTFGVSILLVDAALLRIGLAAVAIVLVIFLSRITIRR